MFSEEQVELAKARLLEVTFKAHHCSIRAFNLSDFFKFVFKIDQSKMTKSHIAPVCKCMGQCTVCGVCTGGVKFF